MARKGLRNEDLVKRIRGKAKIKSKARHYPYIVQISRHEHVWCDSRGTRYLDTRTGSKRYTELSYRTPKKKLEDILRKI